MSLYSLIFLGFGNVGQALGRLLLRKRDLLRSDYGIDFTVAGVATGRRGQWRGAVDLEQVLELSASGQPFPSAAALPIPQFLEACADGRTPTVVFESIPVNYESGQPAVEYLRAALQRGMYAISANKGPVVHAYRELTHLAQAHGVKYYFESAVMDGAPIFSLARETLPAARIHGFHGILNSTTNLILDRMAQGESFENAVSYAQSIGIAETDPLGDLEGWDAAVKVAALCTVIMDTPLKPQQVQRRGILELTPQDMLEAQRLGKRWKLVCAAHRQGESVQASVAPQMVGPESPLYGVSGTSSVVTFETDVLPGLSIVETDPGPQTTAYGMLADFLNAVRK